MGDVELKYLQMWRPELAALAAQGDNQAKAELDRRVARRNARAIAVREQKARDE